MKRTSPRWPALLALICLVPTVIMSIKAKEPQPASVLRQSKTEKLAGYMEQHETLHHFSGCVLVMQDDEILLKGSYGWANFEHQVPNTSRTKFRIGSITKPFTAMAIMILQDQGKLHVEDRISKHIPGSPESWAAITIQHLLTHSAGIQHSWALQEYKDIKMQSNSLAAIVDLFKKQDLLFSPGEDFRYSGGGYFVLAQIIEQASGRDYASFLREAIFTPLGMDDSGADHSAGLIRNLASGYVRSGSQILRGPFVFMPNLTGGGNLYSTVEDLARWHQALLAGTLISDSTSRQMFTPYKKNYAFGWTVKERKGRREVQHGGGVTAFKSFILRLPSERICAIVLSNIVNKPAVPAAAVKRIARELVDITLGN